MSFCLNVLFLTFIRAQSNMLSAPHFSVWQEAFFDPASVSVSIQSQHFPLVVEVWTAPPAPSHCEAAGSPLSHAVYYRLQIINTILFRGNTKEKGFYQD